MNLNFCAALKIPSNAADCCPEFGYTEHPRSTGFSHSAYAFAQMTNVTEQTLEKSFGCHVMRRATLSATF